MTGDIKKLKGFKDKYRLRAGNYRVLFELEARASWCMMSATGKIFMSNATLTSAKPPGQLDTAQQATHAGQNIAAPDETER
ncbi:MAG: hypothetical protein WDM76_03500 [Limisphaerales bacterium]